MWKTRSAQNLETRINQAASKVILEHRKYRGMTNDMPRNTPPLPLVHRVLSSRSPTINPRPLVCLIVKASLFLVCFIHERASLIHSTAPISRRTQMNGAFLICIPKQVVRANVSANPLHRNLINRANVSRRLRVLVSLRAALFITTGAQLPYAWWHWLKANI